MKGMGVKEPDSIKSDTATLDVQGIENSNRSPAMRDFAIMPTETKIIEAENQDL